MRKTKKSNYRKKSSVGGSNLPAPYFAAAGLVQPDAAAGKDILSVQPNGAIIRSGLATQNYTVSGGFIPTIGEPFVSAAAQYIAPLAMFAGYKLMQRNKKPNKTRRRSTRRRR